jgi:hypothetical protein
LLRRPERTKVTLGANERVGLDVSTHPTAAGRAGGQDNFTSRTNGERNDFFNYQARVAVNVHGNRQRNQSGQPSPQHPDGLAAGILITLAKTSARSILVDCPLPLPPGS